MCGANKFDIQLDEVISEYGKKSNLILNKIGLVTTKEEAEILHREIEELATSTNEKFERLKNIKMAEFFKAQDELIEKIKAKEQNY